MNGLTPRQLALFGQGLPLRRGTRGVISGPRPANERRDKVVHFFAVLPPDEIRPEITRLRLDMAAEQKIYGKPVTSERLHISVARLFDCDPADLPGEAEYVGTLAEDIASRVRMPRFDVCFDRLQTFIVTDRRTQQRKYLLVLCGGGPMPGLLRLRGLFQRSFARRELPTTAKAFNPHISLIYGNRPIAPREIQPLWWSVRDFALVQSFHGQSRHVILKRWPLTG